MQLRDKQMMGYDFHRQKPIDNYILDFFCNELMLGIELDGLTHHNEETIEKDRRKEAKMNELGIAVLRFADNMVITDMTNVLRVIEFWIQDFEEGKKPQQILQ